MDFDKVTSLKTLCSGEMQEEKMRFLVFLLHVSHSFILVDAVPLELC